MRTPQSLATVLGLASLFVLLGGALGSAYGVIPVFAPFAEFVGLLQVIAGVFVIFALPGLLLWAGVILGFLLFGAVAGVVTLIVLRRLTIVRRYLANPVKENNDETVELFDERSFRNRHITYMMCFGGAYFLAFIPYAFLSDYLVYAAPIALFDESGRVLLLAYPLVVFLSLLSLFLALNYRRNRWEPSPTPARSILEWSIFLGLSIALLSLPALVLV